MSPENPRLAVVPRPAAQPAPLFSSASFWFPERLVASAWLEHTPFAFWLIEALAPRIVVELGTHSGLSYSAFCQAILNLRVGARAYAVDTWTGDEHAGAYGEDIYSEFKRYHDERYEGFSQLLRNRFEDALGYFNAGSIDLLHIDGQHYYENVRGDFTSWKPKLSDRAVVLFHDTNVREREFGVFRLWNELRSEYPSFEFIHGHGLGVLGVGPNPPESVAALFASSNNRRSEEFVRAGYARLGVAVKERFLAQHAIGEAERRLVAIEQAHNATRTDLQKRDARLSESERLLAEQSQKRQEVEQALLRAQNHYDELAKATREIEQALLRAQNHYAELAKGTREVEQERESLRSRLTESLSQNRELESQRQTAAQRAEENQAHVERISTELDRRRHQDDDWSKRMQESVQREGQIARELRGALRELSQSNSELDATTEAVANLTLQQNRQTAEYERQRDMLLASLSWRLTKPFRSNLFQVFFRPLRGALRDLRRSMRRQALLDGHADAGPAPIHAQPDESASTPPRSRRVNGQVRVVFLSGEWQIPGHTYRVERAAAAATLAGARVTCLTMATLEEHFATLSETNILIVWRARLTPALERAYALVRANRGTIIYDVDDLMFEPRLAKPEYIDSIRSAQLNAKEIEAWFQSVLDAFVRADVGTAPTVSLAHQMGIHGKAAFVVPNGYDEKTLSVSRASLRVRRATSGDGLIRLGYAAGTRTHQRDFAQIASPVARILRERSNVRLVLFRDESNPMVSIDEFPELMDLGDSIEWRRKVEIAQLPQELARFDVNLAPLEVGNLFCEAKSELKFFESALVEVPTVASPTEPFRLAIRDGETGFLAQGADEWYATINRLIDDGELRRTVGRSAYHDVLWRYGPERRQQLLASLIETTYWRRRGIEADARVILGTAPKSFPPPTIPQHAVLFSHDNQSASRVTVVVPVYNYANFVVEALDSVHRQTMRDLDLVVIDDRSTDDSASLIGSWLEKHADRFNRAIFLQSDENAGLALARNAGFASAETPFVLPLDADNRLLPDCAQRCAGALARSNAAFAYPEIQQFGTQGGVMGQRDFDPGLLVTNNFIDAMALVRKSVWAGAGGYDPMSGWEDYDLWCKCIELGLAGQRVPEILAEYRVHDGSMLATVTNVPAKKLEVIAEMERRHPWMKIQRPETA